MGPIYSGYDDENGLNIDAVTGPAAAAWVSLYWRVGRRAAVKWFLSENSDRVILLCSVHVGTHVAVWMVAAWIACKVAVQWNGRKSSNLVRVPPNLLVWLIWSNYCEYSSFTRPAVLQYKHRLFKERNVRVDCQLNILTFCTVKHSDGKCFALQAFMHCKSRISLECRFYCDWNLSFGVHLYW